MTLLIISPDYASHLLPLATLGVAWREAGERVVVATGPATAAIVEGFGFERAHLQLGRGSNPGVIRAEEQPAGEDDALRGFFDATRRGMVAALRFQAEARLDDLIWEPVRTARAVQEVVAEVQPDAILVDHLAFSARLALTAAGISFADVVLGHPSALPVGDEVYGYPPSWPAAFTPHPGELRELHDLCERVSESFTREWNTALTELNPAAPPSREAFHEHGELLLYNYPAELVSPGMAEALPPHAFLGSAVREEPADAQVDAWLAENAESAEGTESAESDAPIVYVSFGSFLSVRDDVLARVVGALRDVRSNGRPVRAAIALGSADRAVLGELPSTWLVREFLPQVTILAAATAAVTHGGNNSVTEAMTFGVPLVVLPFSTDQFAGAAALEAAGFGVALDPNSASEADIRDALDHVIDDGAAAADSRARLAQLSADLRAHPGRHRARAAVYPASAEPASAVPPSAAPPRTARSASASPAASR